MFLKENQFAKIKPTAEAKKFDYCLDCGHGHKRKYIEDHATMLAQMQITMS